MTNHCPKCGAYSIASEGNSPEPTCNSLLSITGAMMVQSDFCRGRAEAIAELDAWHTGEPEHSHYCEIIVDAEWRFIVKSIGGHWFSPASDDGYETLSELLMSDYNGYDGSEVRWREVRQ